MLLVPKIFLRIIVKYIYNNVNHDVQLYDMAPMFMNLIFLIDLVQGKEEMGTQHDTTVLEVSEQAGANIPFSHMSSMLYSNIFINAQYGGPCFLPDFEYGKKYVSGWRIAHEYYGSHPISAPAIY